jgi:hypothetical protein
MKTPGFGYKKGQVEYRDRKVERSDNLNKPSLKSIENIAAVPFRVENNF